jgi:hypothetical protein
VNVVTYNRGFFIFFSFSFLFHGLASLSRCSRAPFATSITIMDSASRGGCDEVTGLRELGTDGICIDDTKSSPRNTNAQMRHGHFTVSFLTFPGTYRFARAQRVEFKTQERVHSKESATNAYKDKSKDVGRGTCM